MRSVAAASAMSVVNESRNAICPKAEAVPHPAPAILATSVARAKTATRTPSWASARLRRSDRGKRLVLAEDRAHSAADLSERAVSVNGVDDRWHQVLVPLC